ncbi:hypothetical protein J4Q44_G00249650 [Coregonus suidteri]|uniref:Uncharacterized protein n=1 Tax=Coregonus suidteri TaxID=861788 RepID=A0AAN8L900_9TELE
MGPTRTERHQTACTGSGGCIIPPHSGPGAHEHTNDRLWSVYCYKVFNGSKEQPYVNPKAPVQVITGSASTKQGTLGHLTIDELVILISKWCQDSTRATVLWEARGSPQTEY